MRTVFPPGVMFVVLAFCCAAVSGADVKPLAIGSPAPGFDLPGVDGRNHKLADFAAEKVLVVVFTIVQAGSSIWRFTTIPNAPFSVYSQRSTTAFAKFRVVPLKRFDAAADSRGFARVT